MPPGRVLAGRTSRNSYRAATSNPTTTYTHTQRRCIAQTARLSDSQHSSSASTSSDSTPPFQKVFAAPSWSARALLPTTTTSPSSDATTITPKTLHHLLRLSSLPPPTTPSEESALLDTLHTQLHFVRAIQAVDTTGVAPLTSIRNESSTVAVTLDDLKEALAGETNVGFRGRPRRMRESGREKVTEELLVEEKTRDRRERGYYVVESGKAKGGD